MMLKILLVDDHGGFRGMLKRLIEQTFIEVDIIEASTGETAIAISMMEKPEIILMDIQLPKINGFQAAKAIRHVFPKCIIIALSMFDFKKRKSIKEVDDYISKIDLEEKLFIKLRSYIHQLTR